MYDLVSKWCQQFLVDVFDRLCDITWHAYFAASDSDCEEELQWARGRNRNSIADLNLGNGEAATTLLEALAKKESQRFARYTQLYPDCCFDLGADPDAAPMKSAGHRLHAAIKQQGLLRSNLAQRWMCVVELLESMGFPSAVNIRWRVQCLASSVNVCQGSFRYHLQRSARVLP